MSDLATNSYTFGTYILNVGCPPGISSDLESAVASTIDSSWTDFMTSDIIYVGNTSDLYHFKHNGVPTGSTYTCGISSTLANFAYKSRKDENGTDLSTNLPTISQTITASNNPCDQNDCGKLSLSHSDYPYVMIFEFDVNVIGYESTSTKVTRTVSQITLNVTCWGHPYLSLSFAPSISNFNLA